MNRPHHHYHSPTTRMTRNLLLPTLMAIGMIGAFSYSSSGLSLIVTFVPGVVLAYILYLLTCYRVNPVAEQLVPAYFLSLGVEFLHFAEEHHTRFDMDFPRVVRQPRLPARPVCDIQYARLFSVHHWRTGSLPGR